jgi:hypothetical protein
VVLGVWCAYSTHVRKINPEIPKIGSHIKTFMGNVEHGERNIATLNLIRIAKTLKVEVDELFSPTKILNIN